MAELDEVYAKTAGLRDGVDHKRLRPLLEEVYSEALRRPFDPPALRAALVGLAEFLCSALGRTSEYCSAVDWFFQDLHDLWTPATGDLPKDYRDVFLEFCFLHGAVEQPEFHSTPEELLKMVQKVGARV